MNIESDTEIAKKRDCFAYSQGFSDGYDQANAINDDAWIKGYNKACEIRQSLDEDGIDKTMFMLRGVLRKS